MSYLPPSSDSARPFAEIKLRSARIDDAAQLAQIHLLTWQATYRDLLSAGYLAGLANDIDRRAQVLADAIATEKMSVQVVEQNGQLVAWASFGSSRDAEAISTTAELRAINLLPQVWSQGIGTRLWRHVRQLLINAGYTAATVWVLQGNDRAIGFYQAAGFVVEPRTQMTVVEQGEPLPLVRYRVVLNSIPDTP